MASGPITSWQIDGETMETVTGFNHPIGKRREGHIKPFLDANKGPSSQGYGFSSGHIWM